MISIIDTYLLGNCDFNALGHLFENMNKYESFNVFLNDPYYNNDDLSMLTIASIYGTLLGNFEKLKYLNTEDIVFIKYQYRHYYLNKCPFEYRGFVIDKLVITESNLDKINFLKEELMSLKLEKLKGDESTSWNKSQEENLFKEAINNEFFEKCIHLIELLIENHMNFLDGNYNTNEMSIPIDTKLGKKMILLDKLGIIQTISNYVGNNSSGAPKIKKAQLIKQIIGIGKVTTIERLLTVLANPNSLDKNIPNQEVFEEVATMIENILNPKK